MAIAAFALRGCKQQAGWGVSTRDHRSNRKIRTKYFKWLRHTVSRKWYNLIYYMRLHDDDKCYERR